MTIVFDHQKGLILAMKSILLSARHCFWCHHIAENIKAAFNNHDIIRKFWKTARAYRPYEYEVYMNEIRSVDERAFQHITLIGCQYWTTTFVHGWRYDMLTSNAAKCTNSLPKDIRVLPITKQIEEIRAKLTEFFQR